MMKSDHHVKISRTMTVAAALAALCCNGDGRGQCLRYSIDLIQSPGPCFPSVWPPMAALGISETGEMCGTGGTCGSQSSGFAWYGTLPLYYLPMPPGFAGLPWDINSSRQMVGKMNQPDQSYHAFFHHNGVTTDLGFLPGDSESEATGISEDGTVCGSSTYPNLRAFVWKKGQMSAIPLPMGPNSQALGISNNGLICGWMGQFISSTSHAFVYNSSSGQIPQMRWHKQ